MITNYRIWSIRPRDVGQALIDDLASIYPEGAKVLETTFVDFTCLLPEGAPRLEAILARLEEAGLKPWVDTSRERDRAHEFRLSKVREYDSDELESVDLLKLIAPTYVKAGSRDEQGRIKLGVDTLEADADIAFPSLAGARYVVPERIKELFESSGLRGIAFRPTVPRRDGGFGGPTTWKRAGGPWWELTSDVTMPSLSPRMALTDGNGRPLRDGDYSRGVIPREGLYAAPELRYLASSMASMPPFDLARTFEPMGANPTPEDGRLIASQRFFRFCREHGVKADWVPVRIDAGDDALAPSPRPRKPRRPDPMESSSRKRPAPDESGMADAFTLAVLSGEPETVEAAILDGVDVDRAGRPGTPPLVLAMVKGYDAIVRLLLNAGADVNQPDRDTGKTALHVAVAFEREDFAGELVSRGADVNAAYGQSRMTALLIACRKGHRDLARLLLEAGANPNVSVEGPGESPDEWGMTPLLYAASGGDSKLLQLLIEHGAALDSAKSNGLTPLMVAAYKGQRESVKVLVEAGAEANLINAADPARPFTALDLATMQGHTQIVEYLKSRGAIAVG